MQNYKFFLCCNPEIVLIKKDTLYRTVTYSNRYSFALIEEPSILKKPVNLESKFFLNALIFGTRFGNNQ